MARKLDPIIGEWYRDHGEQRVFEVVAMDEDDGKIDIQYADGDLLELNHDAWSDLLLSMAPPPDAHRSIGDSSIDMDTDNGELPAADWHDSHDGLGGDDDY